jgi:hypothetical protein
MIEAQLYVKRNYDGSADILGAKKWESRYEETRGVRRICRFETIPSPCGPVRWPYFLSPVRRRPPRPPAGICARERAPNGGSRPIFRMKIQRPRTRPPISGPDRGTMVAGSAPTGTSAGFPAWRPPSAGSFSPGFAPSLHHLPSGYAIPGPGKLPGRTR